MKTFQNRRDIRVYCPIAKAYVKVIDNCYTQNCFHYYGLDAFKIDCRFNKTVKKTYGNVTPPFRVPTS